MPPKASPFTPSHLEILNNALPKWKAADRAARIDLLYETYRELKKDAIIKGKKTGFWDVS